MKPITLRQFFKQFPDDETCLEHLFTVRFGQGHKCPKCEREAKWYPIKAERAYSCQWCGHHLHPTVGTLFEKSRTPLQLWFYAIYLFTTTRHGVSGKELQRQLGVTYKCAYRMGQQIRGHMAGVDGEPPLSGNVEIDETMIGGKRPGKRGRGAAGKTAILGMMQRDGDVMTHVVPNVKRATLRPIIDANVEKGSTVNTDELRSYTYLGTSGYTHKTVNHGCGEYVNGDSHVNSIEGYWSHLKKSIRSTHIHVSGKHLSKYAKEFEYRFNSRKNPEGMFPELISTFPKDEQ
jgi:transposase-like protein